MASMEKIGEIVNRILNTTKSETSIKTCQSCEGKIDIAITEAVLRQKLKEYNKTRMEDYIKKIIPRKYRDVKLSDFNESIKKQAEYFLEEGVFLFITGKCGTGKTHLACAMAVENMDKYETIIYYKNITDLIIEIKGTFNNEETECSIIERMSKSKVIFDDIGSFKTTDFSIEALYAIIDRRYREEKKTIFTSNLSIYEIAKTMGDRIASRLASGMVIELTGKDRRIK